MRPHRHPLRRLGRSPVVAVVAALVLLAGTTPAAADDATQSTAAGSSNAFAEPTDDSGEGSTPVPGGDHDDQLVDQSGTEPDAAEPTAPEQPADPASPTSPEPGASAPEQPAPEQPRNDEPSGERPSSDAESADPPTGPTPYPAEDAEPGSTDEGEVAALAEEPSALAADAPAGLRLEPEQTEVTAGEPVTFIVWADGEPGSAPVDVTSEATFEFVGGSGSCEANVCRSERAGAFVVKATYAGLVDLASLTARAGEPATFALTPASATALRNEVRVFRPVLRDEFGNLVEGAPPAVDYTFSAGLECEVSGVASCRSATVGAHQITAIVRDDPARRASATLVVEPGEGVISDLTVTVSSTDATAGDALQVTASGTDNDGEPMDVTSETTFSVTTTDANAFNEVGGGCEGATCTIETAGSFFIVAQYRGLYATVGVDVAPAAAESLVLRPGEAHVGVGQPQWFQVAAADRFGNELALEGSEVTLTADAPAMCSFVICGATEAGTYTVRANAFGMSATAQLSVHPAATAAPDQVARIAVVQATVPVEAGQPAEFVVYGFDADGRPLGTLTEHSTLTIEGAGSWTTPAGTQSLGCEADTCTATVAGEHTVTAAFGDLSATTSFVVTAGSERVTTGLAPGNAVIRVGERQRYDIGSMDEYGNRNGSMSAPFLLPLIASEGAQCEGQSCWSDTPGTYVIGMDMTAMGELYGEELGGDSNWIYRAVLTVLPAEVERIEVTPDAARVAAGEPITLTATAYDADDRPVGDVTDATAFGSDGEMSCEQNVCRSTVAGTYAIEGNHEGLTDSVQVTVTAAAPDRDLLTPAASVIRVGEAVDYTVTRVDEFDNLIGTVTGDYAFTASDGAACEAARCTSRQPGVHTVTAMAPGRPSLSARLTVELPDSAYLVITPDRATIAAGDAAPFTAVLHDATGSPVSDVTAETTFRASEGADCSAAVCTSTTAGSYTITGDYDDLTDDAELTVLAAAVDRIAVSPDGATIDAGETQAFSVAGFDEYDNPVGDLTDDATFEISAPGACVANACGSEEGGEFDVTASYVVPVAGVPGPEGPQGPTARRRTAPAAAPGDTLTATASLTVRAPDRDPGDDGDDDRGNDKDSGSDRGDDDTGSTGEDEGERGADASGRPDDGSGVLPAAGAGLEWWHAGTGVLLLLTGLACVRRARSRGGATA